MQLPFLKESKRPRVARPEENQLQDEKLINGSESDNIDAHCAGELMEAVKANDPAKFRQAVKALVLNMFEEEQDDAA